MRVILISVATMALLSGCKTLDFSPEPTEITVDKPEPPTQDWTEYAPDELPTIDWVAGFGDGYLSELMS